MIVDRNFSVDYGVQMVPYDGGLCPDMQPELFGRPVRWDGIVTAGKHKGERLSQANVHWVSWAFQNAARQPNAPGWLLQLLWTWGLAVLNKERIRDGDQKDALVNLWCVMRRDGINLPAGGWDEREFWQPDEYEAVMGEIVEEVIGNVIPDEEYARQDELIPF